MILCVDLHINAFGGVLVFSSTSQTTSSVSGTRWDSVCRFVAQPETSMRMALEPASIHRLPEHLRIRIIHETVTQDQVQIASINNRRNIVATMQPLLVSRVTTKYSDQYLQSSHFQTQVKTAEGVADESGRFIASAYREYLHSQSFVEVLRTYQQLKRLLYSMKDYLLREWRDPRIDQIVSLDWPNLRRWPSVEINMRFELVSTEALSLEDIRFDVMQCILTALKVTEEQERNFVINLHVSDLNGQELQDTLSTTITFTQLRLNVFEAWETLDPKDTGNIDQCPQVWINSLETVVEVVAAPHAPLELQDRSKWIEKDRGPYIHIAAHAAPAYYQFMYLEYLVKPATCQWRRFHQDPNQYAYFD